MRYKCRDARLAELEMQLLDAQQQRSLADRDREASPKFGWVLRRICTFACV